jgi:hypothetical protein
MYRHSLFLETCDAADTAEAIVKDQIHPLEDCYQTNDGESGNIEVRFFTVGRLASYAVKGIVRITKPVTYALNCDDGD